jgi:hypothetical protein
MTSKCSKLNALDLWLVSFVSMKLANVIDWSWWVVLIPLWVILFQVVIIGALESNND